MYKTFTSIIELNNYVEKSVEKSIEKVSKIVRDKLEEIINEDFYSLYAPQFYTRTYSFLKSPKYNILNKNSAEIFINTDVMHYLGISGEDVANLASYGFHGNIDIFRPGFYWTDFIQWCDNNLSNILKEELKKEGLNII